MIRLLTIKKEHNSPKIQVTTGQKLVLNKVRIFKIHHYQKMTFHNKY